MKQSRSPMVETLRRLPRLFTQADLAKFVSQPYLFVARAQEKGFITRLRRGYYHNVLFGSPRPKVEEVACFVRRPTYVSCEWALNYHGVLLQAPRVCTAVTLSPSVGSRNTVEYGMFVIEYSHVADRLFFGYEPGDGFTMALPEKALLDAVYLRGRVPFADELDYSEMDRDRLMQMAEEFPATTRAVVCNALDRFGGAVAYKMLEPSPGG